MSLPDRDDAVRLDDSKKIALLYNAINEQLNIKYIERILQKEGDINVEIPKNCNSTSTDYNLLHFTFSKNNVELFKLLLDNGADYAIKNCAGRTIIHRAIQDERYKSSLLNDRFKNPYIDLVLSAQLKSENSSSLCSDYGISHFHAACMINHIAAVEFFLKSGTSVEQSVHTNSPIFKGFTPLHFAARYSCIQTVEILLRYGANIHSKNSVGKTALNILMERKIGKPALEVEDANEKIIELLLKHDNVINKNFTIVDDFGLSNLHISCTLKDTSIVESILEKIDDINHAIKISSPFCPGYTPLHFAAIFNFNTVKLLMNKGADIEIKDAKGTTPFELCLQRHCAKDIHFILSSKQEWKNIVLSDNRTKLLDLVSVMESTEQLFNFIDSIEFDVYTIIPYDSPLWPGYTLLHLAIVFSERIESENLNSEWIDDCQKIKECLNEGIQITTPDAKDCTALHLAFYLQKHRIVELLLNRLWTKENRRDKNNLSYIHIACVAENQDAVERFLCGDIDINERVESSIEWKVVSRQNADVKARNLFINPGSTALHISVANGNATITEMLLDEGADVHAKDSNGFTPIHRLLTAYYNREVGELLFKTNGLKDVVGPGGLNHLHVASHLGSENGTKKLLGAGSNVNAPVTYRNDSSNESSGGPSKESLSFLSRYAGFTPINFAMSNGHFTISCYLMQMGADLFVENPKTRTPMYQIMKQLPEYCEFIIPPLMTNDTWKERVNEEFGLTMVQLACCAVDPEMCIALISLGDDVNAQIRMDSPGCAGYTSLHFAAIKALDDETESHENLMKIFSILINSGADMTMSNREKDTALHMLGKISARSDCDSFYANFLLKSIKDFSVNPTDERGISFFHIACMKNDLSAAERYLSNGADVNQPISYFSDKYSGCSPLHLALGYRSTTFEDVSLQIGTVNLLLHYNADVHARDSSDNTPLHKAATFVLLREAVLNLIISKMTDLNTENVHGETALEILLKTGNAKWQEINYMLERGCSINSYNSVSQEGYIPRIFTNPQTKDIHAFDNPTLQKFINSQYITEIDSNSRTCLHNLVSIGFFYVYDHVRLIKEFVKRGCDINHQDSEGRTAIHRATLFKNNRAIMGLIKNGADINITDNQGKTAFSYAFEEGFPRDLCSQQDYHNPEHVIQNIASHVYKMILCKLDISNLNRQLLASSSDNCPLWDRMITRWNYSKERAKNAKIGSTSMTLYDFLFKVDAKIAYPNMTSAERQEINNFLQNINDYKCGVMDYLVKHKINQGYKKQLIIRATPSLNTLVNRQLPEMCCYFIVTFLCTADMKNIIKAVS